MKSVLPWIALLLCACGSDVTPPPTQALPPELEQLCRRVDRLVDALERSTSAAASVGQPAGHVASAPAERTAAEESVAALKQRVAQLEGEIDILRTQAAMAAGTLAAAPRPARIEPLQKEVVDRLLKSRQRDDENRGNATLAEMLLMGPAQVLQMLGMPTGTSLLQEGVRWEYEMPDEALCVVFVNGQVMDVH